jgi:hypothetical protein
MNRRDSFSASETVRSARAVCVAYFRMAEGGEGPGSGHVLDFVLSFDDWRHAVEAHRTLAPDIADSELPFVYIAFLACLEWVARNPLLERCAQSQVNETLVDLFAVFNRTVLTVKGLEPSIPFILPTPQSLRKRPVSPAPTMALPPPQQVCQCGFNPFDAYDRFTRCTCGVH